MSISFELTGHRSPVFLMIWKPNWVEIGLDGRFRDIFFTASSKGRTIWPVPNQPRSPPFDLLGQVEYSFASCSNRAPFWMRLNKSSAKLLFLTNIWLAHHSITTPLFRIPCKTIKIALLSYESRKPFSIRLKSIIDNSQVNAFWQAFLLGRDSINWFPW